jgi:hypothetical protein
VNQGKGNAGAATPRPLVHSDGVGVYFKSFFAAFSTPLPLFFLPPDFLVFLPVELLATFLISFSSPAMLTSHSPSPTGV